MDISVPTLHWMTTAIPLIKITDNTDANSIRRPHSKTYTFDTLYCHWMRTQNFINFIVNTRLKLFNILNLNRRRKSIGVTAFYRAPSFISHTIVIARYGLFRKKDSKIILIHFLHLCRFLTFYKNFAFLGPRKICLHKNTFVHFMRS